MDGRDHVDPSSMRFQEHSGFWSDRVSMASTSLTKSAGGGEGSSRASREHLAQMVKSEKRRTSLIGRLRPFAGCPTSPACCGRLRQRCTRARQRAQRGRASVRGGAGQGRRPDGEDRGAGGERGVGDSSARSRAKARLESESPPGAARGGLI